jgi:hypothetical protein
MLCTARKTHVRYVGLERTMLSKLTVKEIRCKGMDWINLGEDKAQWRALLNIITNED